ncbi:MAG: tail fiber domain-containing protein [Candidatus Omnitrophica bacterium]|nr:tail fiber domain-containing protein [Candidatus Omnitrophota bacterium]
MNAKRIDLSKVFILSLLSLLLSSIFWNSSFAAPPREMYIQAKVTNKQGDAITGSHSVIFRLYSASSGGTAIWTETQTVTVGTDGILGAYLGSSTALPTTLDFDSTYYLSIEVDSDGEMSPRIKLSAAPYGLGAYMIGGLEATSFLRSDAADTAAGNITFQKADPSLIFDVSTDDDTDFWLGVQDDAGEDDDDLFQIGGGTTPGTGPFLTLDTSGNLGIGTVAPTSKLYVVGDITATGSVSAASGSGGWIDDGTVVRLAASTDTVGIGTATPGSTLDVEGTLQLQSGASISEFSTDGTLADDSDTAVPTEKAVKTYVDTEIGGISQDKITEGDTTVEVVDTEDGYITLTEDNDEKMRITGGQVGIGTTAPGASLDVVGGSVRTDNQLISTVATGTAPLAVTSTTVVTNLNADTVDGSSAADFMAAGTDTWVDTTGDTMTGQLIMSGVASDITTGSNEHLALMPEGTGKVGIGTSSPGAMLEVAGDVLVDTTGADELDSVTTSDVTTSLAVATNPGGTGDVDGVIKLGKDDGGWQSIWYDASLRSNQGQFVFSRPIKVQGSSPALITFDDGSSTQTLTFDSTADKTLSYSDSMSVNALEIRAASPSVLSFGTGSNLVNLIYDPETDGIRFSRGVFDHDFRNRIKNGSFEAFSALEEFHNYDLTYSTDAAVYNTTAGYQGGWNNFAPDEWTYVSGKVFQQAPTFFESGFTDANITSTTYQQDFAEGRSSVRLAYDSGAPGIISQVISGLKPSTLYSVGVKMRVDTGGSAEVDIEGEDASTSTTLSANLTAAATDEMSVSSVSGFPAYGIVLIDSERISYAGLDADNNKFLRLARAVESTTAASHSSGATVGIAPFKVLTTSTDTTYAKFKGQFSTSASAGDVTIKLKATATDGTAAYFDTVQIVAGGTVPEYTSNTLVDTGDQTLYGSLRIGRASDEKGGILSVDKFVRARGIELFTDDPGLSGAIGGGAATQESSGIYPPGQGWNTNGSQATVTMYTTGTYASTAPQNRSYKVQIDTAGNTFSWWYMDDTTNWTNTVGGSAVAMSTNSAGTDLNAGVKVYFSAASGTANDSWYFSASNGTAYGGYDSYAQTAAYTAGETRIYKDGDPFSPYYNKMVFQSGATKVTLDQLAGTVATNATIYNPAIVGANSGGLTMYSSGSYTGSESRAYQVKISSQGVAGTSSDKFQFKYGVNDWGPVGGTSITGSQQSLGDGIFISFSESNYTNDGTITGGSSSNPDQWSFNVVAGSTSTSAGGWTDSGTDVYSSAVTDNVAIGTTVPGGYKLNVSGTANATTLTEGTNAVPNATDHLGFFAATTSAQLAGVLSDETGSGGVAVFATSPTIATPIISTSATVPLVIGGSATTSDLSLQTTSAAGEAGADMHFLVGNNGQTEAMTILNSGYVGIGSTVPTAALDINGNIQVSGTITGTVATAGGWTDAGTSMYPTNVDDNVAIGTTDPGSYDLNVAGTANMGTLSIGGTAVTASATELNFVDGVTSAIQTQLDSKSAASDTLTGLVQSTAAGTSYITGGSVGIGTTSPQYLLDVDKSATGNYIAHIKNSGTASYGLFIEAGTDTGDYIVSVASKTGSNKFVIRGDGNVGIGTVAPTALLDVNGTANVNTLSIGDTTITPTAAELNFVDGVTSAIQTQLDAKVGTSTAFIGDVTGAYNATVVGNDSHDHTASTISGLGVSDFTSAAISQWTNDSNFITAASTITGLIQSTAAGTSYITGGSVGIGTAVPGGKLDIYADQSTEYALVARNTADANQITHAFDASAGNALFRLWDVNGGLNVNLAASGNSYLNGGNVGIGTAVPGSALEVQGNVTLNDRLIMSGDSIGATVDTAYNTIKGAIGPTINGLTLTGALVDSNFSDDNANITNVYGLKIATAVTGQYTTTNAYGLYVDQPTGATNNYGAYINGNLIVSGTITGTVAAAGGWTDAGTSLYNTELTDKVGIGTATPSQLLDVNGIANVNTLSIGDTTVTSTAAELNILDGVTATATELNYVDGVTSAIQTQLNAKVGTATSFSGDVTGAYNATVVGNDSHDHTASTISGLGVSDFTSAAISQWTNDSNFITAASTITGLIQSTAAGTSYITGGDVGIGTAVPGEKLHVYKESLTDNSQAKLLKLEGKFNDASIDSDDVIGISVKAVNSSGGSGENMIIGGSWGGSAVNTLLAVDGGNVGIGTTVPAAKLHVSAPAVIAGGFYSVAANDADADIWGISTTYYPSHGTAANQWGIKWQSTPNAFSFVGNGSEKLNIDVDTAGHISMVVNGGNVGIGSAVPVAKLDVVGTAEVDGLSIGGTAVTPTAAELNYVDGVTSAIQTQLDAKVGTATSFSGDVTGAYNATVVGNDSHDHTTSTISGLGVADFSSANISQWTNDSGYFNTSNDGAGSGLDADMVDGLHPTQFFNAHGQNHGTYTDFNTPTDFGFRYIVGTTNGPGIAGASQYYNLGIGLGNDYAYTSYAMQLAIPRNLSTPYISVRYRENGAWGSWYKIYAGYADTAAALSSMNISQFTNNSGYFNTSNDGAGSGLDADLLDGQSSAYYMTAATDNWVNTTGDTMSGNLYFNNYGLGVIGTYSDIRYQGVFAMGDAYKLALDGTTSGTLYGIAWTHSNIGGQSKAGLSHQALFMTNGVTQTAIGTGIWTLGGYTQSGTSTNAFMGSVGIGTVAPGAKLHVTSANTGAGLLRLDNTGGSAGDVNGVDFYHNNGTYLQAFIRDEILSSWPTKLHFGVASTSNNAATKMTIQGSNGYVGIGTVSPAAHLQVGTGTPGSATGAGDLYVASDLEVDSTAYLDLDARVGRDFIGTAATSYMYMTGTLTVDLDNDNNGTDKFSIRDGGNTEIFYVNEDNGGGGNVVAKGVTEGSYIGLFKGLGSLPGYGSSRYPTLKTDYSYLYFSVAGAYSAYMGSNGVLTAQSSREKKENFKELDFDNVLAKIDKMPVMEWNYKNEEDSIKHIGPFAEDFHALFGLNGTDNTMIGHSDPPGVALAGVKGLYRKVKEQERVIEELETRIAALEKK